MLQSEFKQRVAAVNVQFGADIGAVIINGARVNKEFFGYLLTRFIFGNHFQDAAFCRRQIVKAGLLFQQTGGAIAAI